jgi:transcriptional regulator with XRE-family HTH domain
MTAANSHLATQPAISHDPRMLTGGQIRAARTFLRWSAKDLAAAADVGIATIHRAEATDDVPNLQTRTLIRVQQALEKAGIQLIDDGAVSQSGGPGVRLRL